MKKIIVGILCACACITYADPYYHRGGSDGVRLATDIVNLVGASAYTLRTITTPCTTVVGYPSQGVVYAEPAMVAPVVTTYPVVSYPTYVAPVVVNPYVGPGYAPYYRYDRGPYYRGDYRPDYYRGGRGKHRPGGHGNGPGHSGGGGGGGHRGR